MVCFVHRFLVLADAVSTQLEHRRAAWITWGQACRSQGESRRRAHHHHTTTTTTTSSTNISISLILTAFCLSHAGAYKNMQAGKQQPQQQEGTFSAVPSPSFIRAFPQQRRTWHGEGASRAEHTASSLDHEPPHDHDKPKTEASNIFPKFISICTCGRGQGIVELSAMQTALQLP